MVLSALHAWFSAPTLSYNQVPMDLIMFQRPPTPSHSILFIQPVCLCLWAPVQLRVLPLPACQRWIVFSPQPFLFCSVWRLESWPIVLRALSISSCRLTANNGSIWGLHLKLPSPPLFFFFVEFYLCLLAHLPNIRCLAISLLNVCVCRLANGKVYQTKVPVIKQTATWSIRDRVVPVPDCVSLHAWTFSLLVWKSCQATVFQVSITYS